MLRSNRRIVQSSRHGVGEIHLAVLILRGDRSWCPGARLDVRPQTWLHVSRSPHRDHPLPRRSSSPFVTHEGMEQPHWRYSRRRRRRSNNQGSRPSVARICFWPHGRSRTENPGSSSDRDARPGPSPARSASSARWWSNPHRFADGIFQRPASGVHAGHLSSRAAASGTRSAPVAARLSVPM